MGPRTTAALWTVFTVAAVGTGLGAVTVVRNALTAPASSALSQSQVMAELATATPRPTPHPAPSTVTGTPPTHSPRSTPAADRSSSPSEPSHSTSGVASPSPGSSRTGSPSVPATRTLASRGGTVVARCTGSNVYLQSWSPQPGYRVEDVRRGPALQADVWFEGAYEVHVAVTCQAGVPVGEVEQEVNDG